MHPVFTRRDVLFYEFFNQFLAVKLRKLIFAPLSERSKDGEVDEWLKSVVC